MANPKSAAIPGAATLDQIEAQVGDIEPVEEQEPEDIPALQDEAELEDNSGPAAGEDPPDNVEPEDEEEELPPGVQDPEATLSEFEVPPLDDSSKERWEQQWKGLKQRESKLDDLEALSTYRDAFLHPNPAVKEDAYRKLGEILGVSPQPITATGEDSDPATPFEYEGEKVLNERKADRSELQILKDEIAALKADRIAEKAQAEKDRYIKEQTPKAIALAAKLHQGWKVTDAMVAQAHVEFPNKKLSEALTKTFPLELAKHYAKVSQTNRGPSHIQSQKRAGGKPVPRPGRATLDELGI